MYKYAIDIQREDRIIRKDDGEVYTILHLAHLDNDKVAVYAYRESDGEGYEPIFDFDSKVRVLA